MPAKMSVEAVATLAARYGVDARTIYRWRAAGVNVNDLEAVADHLLRQHAPAPAALHAAQQLLEKQP